MARYETSAGQRVTHFHISNELTPAQGESYRRYLKRYYPKAKIVGPPTLKYNCHGYSLAQAHAVFEEPEPFIEDDFVEVPMDEARRGDILIYTKGGEIRHTAIVKTVAGGEIRKLRSKWGDNAEVVHKPDEVHWVFGRPKRLLRRN